MKWGFEYGIGGNKNGTGVYIDRLTAAGIPTCWKGTDDAGLCFQAQETGHPDSVLIYRVSTKGQEDDNDYDAPFYHLPPADAAALHYNITAAKWPPELQPSRVWQEPVNEPRAKPDLDKPNYQNMHPSDWLGHFTVEYAILANADGRKVCGPSFSPGEPGDDGKGIIDAVNQYSQPGMLRWLTYCAENPDKAALGVHEYSLALDAYENHYPWRYGRFQAAIAAADLAGIPRTFRIFVTEFGWTLNSVPVWETAVDALRKYTELVARFPQLEAAAIWSLRAGWGGISDQLAAWITANDNKEGNPFTNWIISNQYPDAAQPQPTAAEFGSTLPGETEPPDPPTPPPAPTNLLRNPSFEYGHYDLTGSIQVPNEWVFSYTEGDSNPHDVWPFVPPEVRVLPADQLPANERDVFGLDGRYTVKSFKGFGAWNGRLSQAISGLSGEYQIALRIFADLVKGYNADGSKIWADDPNGLDGKVRVLVNDTTVKPGWVSLTPGVLNEFSLAFPAQGDVNLAVEFMCPYPLDNSGLFVDDWSLRRLGDNGDDMALKAEHNINWELPRTAPGRVKRWRVIGQRRVNGQWENVPGWGAAVDIEPESGGEYRLVVSQMVEDDPGNPSPPPVVSNPLPQGALWVDVSANNKTVNLTTLKANGVQGVGIRLSNGIRKNTDTTDENGIDKMAFHYIEAAESLGMPWLGYHFSNENYDDVEQIRHFLGIAQQAIDMGYVPEMGLWIDFETPQPPVQGSPTTEARIQQQLTTLARERPSIIADYGPYTSKGWWDSKVPNAAAWVPALELKSWVAAWVADSMLVNGWPPTWWHPSNLKGFATVYYWQWTSKGGFEVGHSVDSLDLNFVGNTAVVPGTPPTLPPPDTYSTSFMRGEPGIWRVIRRADGSGEDVWELPLTGIQDVRVKNQTEGEWYEYRSDGVYRLRDTSPANDSQGNERLYTLSPGKIAPGEATVGVVYAYTNEVQFWRKSDCEPLGENSGTAVSTFCLKGVVQNYTFPETGVTVDWLYVTEQTNEIQLYAITDGRVIGWCGGGAEQENNVWSGQLAEIHYDRQIPATPPEGYC